jgi:phage host-nuclease inhibitor protein Gam
VRNRDGFNGARSRALNFGVVRFRLVTRLVIHSAANTLAALKALLGKSAERYIRVKSELDKEALETMPADTLSQVGVTRKTDEKFSYSLDEEKLESA